MSSFYEQLIHEYPFILKKKNWNKEVRYRIRVVKRKVEGIPRTLVDIREFLINERKAILTDVGIYLNQQELDVIIANLVDARRKFFGKESANGTGARDRSQDISSSQKEEKLP